MDDKPPDRPFARHELGVLGISRSRLVRWINLGIVRTLYRGVYVPTHLSDDITTRAAAAALVLPAHCVVVDRSAALLHGIDVLDYAETVSPPRLEVASINGGDRTQRAHVLGGARDLVPEELTRVAGVLVTTPVRTACDVACLRGRHRALATLDAFRRDYRLTVADLDRQAKRFRGRRGVIQLRELIPLSTDRSESQPESWTRMIIVDAGLPPPTPNASVWIDGWGWVRLDLLYEHLRIAVEFDGVADHSSAEDRAHDELRRRALREAGWIVIVLRRGDLLMANRSRWLAELSDAIDARSPLQAGKRIYSRAARDPRYRARH